jgi:hypothetical protein
MSGFIMRRGYECNFAMAGNDCKHFVERVLHLAKLTTKIEVLWQSEMSVNLVWWYSCVLKEHLFRVREKVSFHNPLHFITTYFIYRFLSVAQIIKHWIMNWKISERKRSWYNMRYCAQHLCEGIKGEWVKDQQGWCSGQCLKSASCGIRSTGGENPTGVFISVESISEV